MQDDMTAVPIAKSDDDTYVKILLVPVSTSCHRDVDDEACKDASRSNAM